MGRDGKNLESVYITNDVTSKVTSFQHSYRLENGHAGKDMIKDFMIKKKTRGTVESWEGASVAHRLLLPVL